MRRFHSTAHDRLIKEPKTHPVAHSLATLRFKLWNHWDAYETVFELVEKLLWA